jgi:hypothetical protein
MDGIRAPRVGDDNPLSAKSRVAQEAHLRPTVERKTSAKVDPRCGVAMVVTDSTLNDREFICVTRYRQSSPPYETSIDICAGIAALRTIL